ncbi:hypothetical protein JDV02_005237 [Purpureocillium takamizusanense]|uniref:Uncharacterized protein n=1 Tax=Purpureocillium takamizusanense TaxID=2060973 RepID=A0A9Q8QG51_9HYPO|nr:uncharacterized protein JDV02_005237 [Purpureocillium takamizusanense]UNI19018.1 hypothetical protein JDV02_005237 [Purpureocillium takamizusanense]
MKRLMSLEMRVLTMPRRAAQLHAVPEMAARHRNAPPGDEGAASLGGPSLRVPTQRSPLPALCHAMSRTSSCPPALACSATVRLARHGLVSPDHMAPDKGCFPWPSRHMRAGGGWRVAAWQQHLEQRRPPNSLGLL